MPEQDNSTEQQIPGGAGRSRSIADIVRERFGTTGRKKRRLIKSGDDIISEKYTAESLEGRQGSEVEVENNSLGVCGHPLTKESYRLPDGRRTCNSDSCRRRCDFVCQRILPTPRLWNIVSKRVCSLCIVWFLCWQLIRGILLGFKQVFLALSKHA